MFIFSPRSIYFNGIQDHDNLLSVGFIVQNRNQSYQYMHFKYIWFYFQVIFHMYVLKKNDNISIVSRVNYAWVNKTVFNIRLNKLITDPFFNHHKNEGGYNSLSPWQAFKMKNGTPQTLHLSLPGSLPVSHRSLTSSGASLSIYWIQ